MTRSDHYRPDAATDEPAQPVSRGIGASWLAACMAHDMLYGGDVDRTVALMRRADTDNASDD